MAFYRVTFRSGDVHVVRGAERAFALAARRNERAFVQKLTHVVRASTEDGKIDGRYMPMTEDEAIEAAAKIATEHGSGRLDGVRYWAEPIVG